MWLCCCKISDSGSSTPSSSASQKSSRGCAACNTTHLRTPEPFLYFICLLSFIPPSSGSLPQPTTLAVSYCFSRSHVAPTGLLISLSVTCPLLFSLSFNRQSPDCQWRPLIPAQPIPLSLRSLHYISWVLSPYFISSQALLSASPLIPLNSLYSFKVSKYISGYFWSLYCLHRCVYLLLTHTHFGFGSEAQSEQANISLWLYWLRLSRKGLRAWCSHPARWSVVKDEHERGDNRFLLHIIWLKKQVEVAKSCQHIAFQQQ